MNRETNQNMPYENEDLMYPEVYHKFAPIADQLLRDMERQYGDIYLNEDLLNQMVEEAIRRTGMDPMPMQQSAPASAGQDGDAVPAMNDFGRHGNRDRDRDKDRGRDRDRWRRYDRGAVSDIYRILLLQQIFGRRRPRWRWR